MDQTGGPPESADFVGLLLRDKSVKTKKPLRRTFMGAHLVLRWTARGELLALSGGCPPPRTPLPPAPQITVKIPLSDFLANSFLPFFFNPKSDPKIESTSYTDSKNAHRNNKYFFGFTLTHPPHPPIKASGGTNFCKLN